MSRHVSCLATVCLLGIAKCLFCAETLAFPAKTERRPLGPVTRCLLTTLFTYLNDCSRGCFMAVLCFGNYTLAISQFQTL